MKWPKSSIEIGNYFACVLIKRLPRSNPFTWHAHAYFTRVNVMRPRRPEKQQHGRESVQNKMVVLKIWFVLDMEEKQTSTVTRSRVFCRTGTENEPSAHFQSLSCKTRVFLHPEQVTVLVCLFLQFIWAPQKIIISFKQQDYGFIEQVCDKFWQVRINRNLLKFHHKNPELLHSWDAEKQSIQITELRFHLESSVKEVCWDFWQFKIKTTLRLT